MRLGVMQRWKPYGYERVECAMHGMGAVEVFYDAYFSFVSAGVGERKRACVAEKGHVAIAGRMGGGFCYGLYILLSLPLVSWFSEWGRGLPHSGALAIGTVAVSLSLSPSEALPGCSTQAGGWTRTSRWWRPRVDMLPVFLTQKHAEHSSGFDRSFFHPEGHGATHQYVMASPSAIPRLQCSFSAALD